MTNFQQYRNKETGEIVEGILDKAKSPAKDWGMRWSITTRTQIFSFRTKKDFNNNYELIKDNDSNEH